MVNKGPRDSEFDNAETRKATEELKRNPPILIWETVPGSGGIRVARLVHDPVGKPGRPKRPTCDCNLYGSPKRRYGPHHDEGCGRRDAAARR